MTLQIESSEPSQASDRDPITGVGDAERTTARTRMSTCSEPSDAGGVSTGAGEPGSAGALPSFFSGAPRRRRCGSRSRSREVGTVPGRIGGVGALGRTPSASEREEIGTSWRS